MSQSQSTKFRDPGEFLNSRPKHCTRISSCFLTSTQRIYSGFFSTDFGKLSLNRVMTLKLAEVADLLKLALERGQSMDGLAKKLQWICRIVKKIAARGLGWYPVIDNTRSLMRGSTTFLKATYLWRPINEAFRAYVCVTYDVWVADRDTSSHQRFHVPGIFLLLEKWGIENFALNNDQVLWRNSNLFVQSVMSVEIW